MKNSLENHKTWQRGHDWHSERYVRDWIKRREEHSTVQEVLRRKKEWQQVLDAVRDSNNQQPRFLDLGTGWGRFSKAILEAFPGSSGVAIDYSEPMLDAARESLASLLDRIRFLNFDLTQAGSINGLPGKFDIVLCTQTLHHFNPETLGRIYREVRDVLAPGGQFLNIDRVARPPLSVSRIVYRLTGALPSKARDSMDTRLSDRFALWFDQRFSSLLRMDGNLSDDVTLDKHLDLIRSSGLTIAWTPISPQRFAIKGGSAD